VSNRELPVNTGEIVLSAFGKSTHRERQCALRRSLLLLLLLLLLCWAAPNGSTECDVTGPGP